MSIRSEVATYFTCCFINLDEKKIESSWNAGIYGDVKQQLMLNYKKIKFQRSCYIGTIIKKLQSIPGVDIEELHGFISENLIFDSNESDKQHDAREKLKSAKTIGTILHCVGNYYPFWEFDLFERIMIWWDIKKDDDRLKYVDYFKAYALKHKISEFMEINQALKRKYVAPNEIVLKFDASLHESIHKVLGYKESLANILDTRTSLLRLIDVKKGCVLVTYVLPTDIARQMFTKEEWFTISQKEKLKDLSIIWFQYEDKRIYFKRIITKRVSGMRKYAVLASFPALPLGYY